MMNISEITEQLTSYIINIDLILCLIGISLLGNWLLKTSLGSKALSDSEPRRNNMPAYLPFVPLLIWLSTASLASSTIEKLLPDRPAWQTAITDNFTLCISAIITIAVIIFLARASFAQRLKGFGLNVKTIPKDFFFAFVNLLSVWPLMLFMIILTMLFGNLVWGPDFEIQPHQELELISKYPQLSVRVLILFTAVVIVPVFEEMLFRGMFQTTIRSVLEDAPFCERLHHNKNLIVWLSILISSGLFTMSHSDPVHWPPLFVLSLGMGYAYEKSGSLFRPIFIHLLFNAASITAVLYQ